MNPPEHGTSLARVKSNFPMNNIFKLALASALCVFPSIAHACSCTVPPAPKIALQNSAAVFVGRVTSVEKSDLTNKYQFFVSKQWKGIKGNTASVVTANNSAACGINFDENRDYLVYAYKNDDDQLRTNLCSRTKRAEGADAELAELGAPVKNTDVAAYPTDDNGVVQINAPVSFADDTNLPMILLDAINATPSASRFRLNWSFGLRPSWPAKSRGDATALYDREGSTLKFYSRYNLTGESSRRVKSAFYIGVNLQILAQLASSYQPDGTSTAPFTVFDSLTNLGAVRVRVPR